MTAKMIGRTRMAPCCIDDDDMRRKARRHSRRRDALKRALKRAENQQWRREELAA